MFCDKCGNKLDDTTRFCPKCGSLVVSASESSILTIERKMGIFFLWE